VDEDIQIIRVACLPVGATGERATDTVRDAERFEACGNDDQELIRAHLSLLQLASAFDQSVTALLGCIVGEAPLQIAERERLCRLVQLADDLEAPPDGQAAPERHQPLLVRGGVGRVLLAGIAPGRPRMNAPVIRLLAARPCAWYTGPCPP
jgi:hypothetical protein